VLLVLERGESEGHVARLITAAAECKFSKLYLFSFIFDVPFMGRSAKTETH
jgi:hypothetical protein